LLKEKKKQIKNERIKTYKEKKKEARVTKENK
jgi:hypothetical protein